MKYLIALLLTISFNASATSVLLGGWSHHLNAGDYNEKHDFLAVEYNQWVGGTFINSHNNRSYIAGYDFVYETQYVNFGAITGIVKGYTKDDLGSNYDWLIVGSDFMPAVVPYVQINTPYVKPVVGLLGQAVFLTFRVDFNL